MLLFELKKILDKYNFNFGEISDFEEVYGFMDGTVDENTYIAGSPLVEFRKEVEALMDSTGFEYLFVLVGVHEVADGMGLEFDYHLVWNDNGLKNFIFNLATPY